MNKSALNKPSRSSAKPLRDLVGKIVGDAFARQGFASTELVTRWADIAGAEIARVHCRVRIADVFENCRERFGSAWLAYPSTPDASRCVTVAMSISCNRAMP